MWAVEKDPALRSDFCNLTILDRAPERDAAPADARPCARRDAAPAPTGGLAAAAHRTARVHRRSRPGSRVPRAAHRGTVAGRHARGPRRVRTPRRRVARPFATTVGVHAHRRARRRPGRAPPEGPSHDQRRCRGAEAFARAARLRTRSGPGSRCRSRSRNRTRGRNARGSHVTVRRARRSPARRHPPRRRNGQGRRGRNCGCARAPGTTPGACTRFREHRAIVGATGLRRRPRPLRSHRGPVLAASLRDAPGLPARVEAVLGRSRRERERRVRHRVVRGARPVPRTQRECGDRAAPRHAGEHARSRGRRREPVRTGTSGRADPADR